jgi:hypothetical protein
LHVATAAADDKEVKFALILCNFLGKCQSDHCERLCRQTTHRRIAREHKLNLPLAIPAHRS